MQIYANGSFGGICIPPLKCCQVVLVDQSLCYWAWIASRFPLSGNWNFLSAKHIPTSSRAFGGCNRWVLSLNPPVSPDTASSVLSCLCPWQGWLSCSPDESQQGAQLCGEVHIFSNCSLSLSLVLSAVPFNYSFSQLFYSLYILSILFIFSLLFFF